MQYPPCFPNLRPMIKTENFEQVEVTSPKQPRDWLLAHHAQTESVWLVTYKKSAGDAYVSTGQVLDGLLRFGWIDGVRRKLDDRRTMQLIAPRKTLYSGYAVLLQLPAPFLTVPASMPLRYGRTPGGNGSGRVSCPEHHRPICRRDA